MIVDCHCHAGPGDGLSGPWDSDARLGAYLRQADAAGIERTVLFPVFHSDYRFANRAVAEVVRSHPGRFFGFAFVHPVRDRGRVGELITEAVTRHGFRGIKVHRNDAPISAEICDVARAWGLPILYDVMGEVAQVELLARQYPEVPFIIPHLGSFADDWRAQLALIDHLVRHPNVFTDTSGVRRFDLLGRALARAGPGKILFGIPRSSSTRSSCSACPPRTSPAWPAETSSRCCPSALAASAREVAAVFTPVVSRRPIRGAQSRRCRRFRRPRTGCADSPPYTPRLVPPSTNSVVPVM